MSYELIVQLDQIIGKKKVASNERGDFQMIKVMTEFPSSIQLKLFVLLRWQTLTSQAISLNDAWKGLIQFIVEIWK